MYDRIENDVVRERQVLFVAVLYFLFLFLSLPFFILFFPFLIFYFCSPVLSRTSGPPTSMTRRRT